jgi:proline dehydrogenase
LRILNPSYIFVLQIISMEVRPPIHFDDTATAFSYKSDQELRKANFIFTLVNNPTISGWATKAVKIALDLHLPVKGLIKATIFEHFCGGETVEQSDRTIEKLAEFKVGTILDYSVEGEKTEEGFDKTTDEILLTFDKAKGNPQVPFCVFKVTGLAGMALLEKVQRSEKLSLEEQTAFERVAGRVDRICLKAFDLNVPVLVDGEDSWIQDTIDNLAYDMMRKYNGKRAIVFNTFQMYRADMLSNLQAAYQNSIKENYYLGVKIVRGAYMEKERERAEKIGYPDPINPTKEATDNLFNEGLAFCVKHRERISLVCGSHNEHSNLFLASLMEKNGLSPGDYHVWFAQLLGMSDNISFNLVKAGFNVAKYVPYGPVQAVMPYLLRRASENTSVAGQSSRELVLIRKELSRRKSAKKLS